MGTSPPLREELSVEELSVEEASRVISIAKSILYAGNKAEAEGKRDAGRA